MYRSGWAGALLALALIACAPKEAPVASAPAVDTAAVVAGVNDMWARWAVADTAEDLAAIMAMMTENARIDIRGFPPMLGREAALAVFQPVYDQLDYTALVMSPATTVAISNDLVHQAGAFAESYTIKGKPGTMTDHARYAAAIVRGADGQWRIAYMMAMVDSTVTAK